MSKKEYGLILPNKKKTLSQGTRNLNPLLNSDDELENDEEGALNWVEESLKKTASNSGQKSVQRRMLREALSEDATVFQYDEVYDDMKESQNQQKEKEKQQLQKKPKYIDTILKQTQKRKLENERRMERKVQKEREAEGDEFKDKESFVTLSYMKKLEELKLAEMQANVERAMEEKDDATKDKNLGKFYNHLFEQRVGRCSEEPNIKQEPADEQDAEPCNNSKFNKASKFVSKRNSNKNYRSRDESDDEVSVNKNSRIKSEPRSSESDSESQSPAISSYRNRRKESDKSHRKLSPQSSKHEHRYRKHSRDRRNSRSNSRSREKSRRSRSRDRYSRRSRSRSKEKKGSHVNSKENENSRSQGKKQKHEMEKHKERRNRSKSLERKTDKSKDRENPSKQDNNPDSAKQKKTISNALGSTDVNSMKIEDRIKRFHKIFAKRCVGSAYDEAVQKYFMRKSERESRNFV